MKKKNNSFKVMVVFSLLCILCGCYTFGDQLIVHDELFTYDVAFDAAYLRILTVLDNIDDWRLVGTDKNAGAIILRTTALSKDDEVMILIKRVSRQKTSVELHPDSQKIHGVEKILKAIDKNFIG